MKFYAVITSGSMQFNVFTIKNWFKQIKIINKSRKYG